jgi:CubicO group peptidase (beta-lactamase class C family)
MQTVGKQPLDFPPGDAWAYSNTNYALLGWIVERASKEPYTKFVEERILRPVGMNHTSFSGGIAEAPGIAKGYLLRRRLVTPSPRGTASIKSDGALISNLTDLLKWDAAISARRLVGGKSYQLLWGRGTLNSGRSRAYGMGWYLNFPGTGAYLGHSGNSPGFSAGISRFPDLRLTVIVLTNLYPIGGEAMARRVGLVYEPKLLKAPFQETTDTDPKRTEQVKLAINSLATNNPDQTLLEPETFLPMRTSRAKQIGPGPWGALRTIDRIAFGGAKPLGSDTLLTYRITSGHRSFLVTIIWSSKNKLAQATINPDPKR